MRVIPETPIARILLTATLGFIFYGSWAFLANLNEGTDIAIRAAILQGVLSFIFTLVGTAIMEFMVRLSEHNLLRFIMAVVCNMGVVYGFIIGSHIVNQTPNIFLTILPGLIITSLYCFSYAWFLTFGHAAGGKFKMLRLIKAYPQAQPKAAIKLLTEQTHASEVQAKRAIQDIAIGRKSSLYVSNLQQANQLISQLKQLGYLAKHL